MKKLEEIDKELCDQLQKIANEEKALLMSFIAPDRLVRKSPISFDFASISVQDLYNMEKEVEKIKDEGELPKKLHLIIQTPGGDAYASTKIINYLQSNFKEIDAFVPYEASSGGTMMCLAAKTITMDSTSNLSPIDPQVPYKDLRIAATSYYQALRDYQSNYGNYRPEEIPSPYQQLSNQFDPVIAKEMDKKVIDTLSTAHDVLLKSQKPKSSKDREQILSIVFSLGRTEYPHSHVITKDEAIKMGLNIDVSPTKLKLLSTYKRWVSLRLNEEEPRHIIETYNPIKNIKNEKTEEKEAVSLQQNQ